MVNFASTLKELRVRNGMSQKELGEKLGISKSVVSYYELSSRIPSPDVLIKIADTFHVTTDYLLGRELNIIMDISDLPYEDVKLLESVAGALRKKNRKSEPK